jgi:kinetochore protein Spc7/SPC105
MSSRDEMTLPATRPKSRKSLAHIPSSTMDQENMTADIGAMGGAQKAAPIEKPPKKSRSKSIGPGGLDALKDTTGNRRKVRVEDHSQTFLIDVPQSLATVPHPPPKSILKPTMPPLREIPAHISTRKGSPKKTTPPKEDLLIDFNVDGATVTGADNLPNPFEIEGSAAVNETRVTLRTEEEQQAAAREREEKEREELEKEVNSRRDARRKSLANRRVSFAPEATLHTWDVVVEYQDSTISSNSTNSTRRASSATGDVSSSPHPRTPGPPSSDPSEPPSTPPEQIEEDTVTSSPADQRGLHQKKRRRSSGIPPMNFNNPDDEFMSSSPLSGSSTGDADEVVGDEEDDGSNLNSGSEDNDTTTMSIDGGETTDMSMASVKSASSDSSGRLEEALRLAAQQAGTQGIEFDEHGDAEPAEDEEVLASFAPFKKAAMQNLESQQDQENINPFAEAFKAAALAQEDEQLEDDEMTMDMTRAVGGIIPGQQADDDEMSMDVTRAFGGIISNDDPKTASRRKSMSSNRRQSTRRRSSGDASTLEDETMDFTMAVGGIQSIPDQTVSNDNDEDMTMEFTSVIGGVLPQSNPANRTRRRTSVTPNQRSQSKRSRESLDSSAGDDTMDMTVALGRIMPSIAESMTGELDATVGMEMTTAIGGILQPQPSTGNRTRAKKIMELETDLGSSPFQAVVAANSPPKSLAVNSPTKAPAPVHTAASETGSPSLSAFRGKGLRRSTEARKSSTPKSKLDNKTPIKKPATPIKQITPQPSRPTTPGKTPPSKNVVIRTSSPKKLFKAELKPSTTPQSSVTKKATPNKLFHNDKNNGVITPSFVLTPQRRLSSGIGIDRVGLGSPRVAALLDRRGSIGEQARSFVPSQLANDGQGVRFADPRAMEEEIDKEREEDEDKENGRKIMEREADQEEKDATLNLREMIQSLTPKKKPLKGRKSLHVGAAKGILGKRPIELDEDDDEEDNSGMKRLKGHQGSPVKNVKLQGPPSKLETTGRLTRAARKSLENATTSSITPTTTVSHAKGRITTPRGQGRFKDAEANNNGPDVIPFAEKEPIDELEVNEESFGDDRIQLQDFLNMTSIRFMELTTTKRRHTIAPKASKRDSKQDEGEVSLEDCVAAGAATVPMLELFQHVSTTSFTNGRDA